MVNACEACDLYLRLGLREIESLNELELGLALKVLRSASIRWRYCPVTLDLYIMGLR